MERVRYPDLATALRELESRWTSAGDVTTSSELNPGLPRNEFLDVVRDLPLVPHEDAVTWFGWHTVPPERRLRGPHVGASFMEFLKIEQVMSLHRIYLELTAPEAQQEGVTFAQAGWDPQWLPICEAVNGSVVAMDCSAAPDGPAPLFVSHKDYFPVTADLPSLQDLVEVWISLYDDGTYQWRDRQWSKDMERVPQWMKQKALL